MLTPNLFRVVHLTCVLALAAMLGACSGLWSFDHANTLDLPLPAVNLQGEALKKYHLDAASCRSELIRRYGDRSGSNSAITDMRKCLIEKGYVLLS